MTDATIVPYSLEHAPALIERLLPVQKLSAEVYKERKAGSGQTLTALGGFWKGRKPLILNRACILGCLLPATNDLERDLEIFEKLMGMDAESFVIRLRRPRIVEILSSVSIPVIADSFTVDPVDALPRSAPIDLAEIGLVKTLRRQQVEIVHITPSSPTAPTITVRWREDIGEKERRSLEAQVLPRLSYQDKVELAHRPEEVADKLHDHIWDDVNRHLGTNAKSLPDLVEQLGIMRFGHRPRVGDTFCGSGQIPFEAARLGFDVYASDLNPIACMLTWGSLNIVGGSTENLKKLANEQLDLTDRVRSTIDSLGIETDGNGWRAKVFLYCVEARCPQTGWMVPLLPSRVISKGYRVIADLLPDRMNKRYDVAIRTGVSQAELDAAETGTVRRDDKYGEAYLIHQVDDIDYKTSIAALRGDYTKPDGTIANRLRLWEKGDFIPRPSDLLQERLYCIQWMRPKKRGNGDDYEFRSVTEEDLQRELVVQDFVGRHLDSWQTAGQVPDMYIEVGGPPRYQGLDLVRARGWTHWHHLFNPRQLLLAGLVNQSNIASCKFLTIAVVDQSSRLSRWNGSASKGAGGNTSNTFDNQALNTLFTYAHRGLENLSSFISPSRRSFPFEEQVKTEVMCVPADIRERQVDIFVTDPPYGDAVKYEEILDFFIAWLRKNPPPEFADWVWDSRRSLAIKGDDEAFRQGMVAAYRRMAEQMPANGIQVIMFTHQSGPIWADMTNIVWAAGLQVTAAWYVVTETDSALREGSHVKGTVLLVVRKRQGSQRITSDDLAWAIQAEIQEQVETLTGLNQQAKGLYRDENLFEDADLQMAGYAAALRALTRYAIIDGRDMTVEALRPRVRGQISFVDELIEFAVGVANQFLVPTGIAAGHWEKLAPAERFYLKLIEMEARGLKMLDNYQNFAKAFKVRDYRVFMASQRAKAARLQSAVELGRTEMNEGSELYQTPLRAVLYAIMELVKRVDGDEVLRHLAGNAPGYYDLAQRALLSELTGYLVGKLAALRPEEASAARVLGESMRGQKL